MIAGATGGISWHGVAALGIAAATLVLMFRLLIVFVQAREERDALLDEDIAALRAENRGLRSGLGKLQRRTNRVKRLLTVTQAACARRKAQHRHDQAYIDSLEGELPPGRAGELRSEMKARALAGEFGEPR